MLVIHVGLGQDGYWSARFEMEELFAGPEQGITAMLAAIDTLDGSYRTLWATCTRCEFNMGYECGAEPAIFSRQLSRAILARIAGAGAGVAITIYPASPPRKQDAA